MSQIVRFRLPNAPDSICSLFVADENFTQTHIRRFQSLGYILIVELQRPAERLATQSGLRA